MPYARLLFCTCTLVMACLPTPRRSFGGDNLPVVDVGEATPSTETDERLTAQDTITDDKSGIDHKDVAQQEVDTIGDTSDERAHELADPGSVQQDASDVYDAETDSQFLPECKVTQISAGQFHTCAIKSDGTLWCWGRNSEGQLGVGDNVARFVPTQVNLPKPAMKVAAGECHTCAAVSDGTLYCWGCNSHGQTGAACGPVCTSPAVVTGLSKVQDVAAGRKTTCVLTDAMGGTQVWCFGGVYKLPTLIIHSDLVDPILVRARSDTACAVSKANKLVCWETALSGAVPKKEAEDVVEVAVGEQHKCAITTSSKLLCWGLNNHGQIGFSGPGEVATSPTEVPDLPVVQHVGAGLWHTCAAGLDGDVYCWGYNEYAQVLGYPSQDVVKPVNLSSVHGGQVSLGDYHSCAVTAKGHVVCWGINLYGELGNGAQTQWSGTVKAHICLEEGS